MFLRTRQDLCRAIQRSIVDKDAKANDGSAKPATSKSNSKIKPVPFPDPDFKRLKDMPLPGPEHIQLASSVTIPRRRKSAPANLETPPGSSNSSSSEGDDDNEKDSFLNKNDHHHHAGPKRHRTPLDHHQKLLTSQPPCSMSPPLLPQQVYQKDLAVASPDKKQKQDHSPAHDLKSSADFEHSNLASCMVFTTHERRATDISALVTCDVFSTMPVAARRTDRRAESAAVKMGNPSSNTASSMMTPNSTWAMSSSQRTHPQTINISGDQWGWETSRARFDEQPTRLAPSSYFSSGAGAPSADHLNLQVSNAASTRGIYAAPGHVAPQEESDLLSQLEPTPLAPAMLPRTSSPFPSSVPLVQDQLRGLLFSPVPHTTTIQGLPAAPSTMEPNTPPPPQR
ncbi:hypothetical protein ACA910_016723 [Epithemia clementina (nom. ined.)]